jgi:IS30 family transposase
MHDLGKTNREIAKACRCSASTVSETLNKYKHEEAEVWESYGSYEKARHVWEQEMAVARSKNHFRGHIRSVTKRQYVKEKLINAGWSPEIISKRIEIERGLKLSTNTIYRYVKANRKELQEYLYHHGQPYRQRVGHRRGGIKKPKRMAKKYIDQRPEAINDRSEFGHWEGDLVKGPQNGSGYVLLSLIERKTRYKGFIRMPDAKAETALSYLQAFFMRLPDYARRSITLDNGSEFAVETMAKLEQRLGGFQVYYTETYSPQQKGSDEHSNGQLRWFYPKGTDFVYVPKSDLKAVVQRLNDRPMKLHGFEAPQVMFEAELAKSALTATLAVAA